MIKKRYIFIPLFVLTIGVVVVGVLGYILFSRNGVAAEMVFAATEVGEPVGPKVTKDIGPAGGMLASPDGRMTLTIPPNALTEKMTFSIQPITNKVDGGLGLAYRLEPNAAKFSTPLKMSLRYDNKDLNGTVPEALTMAFQGPDGTWHELDVEKLDQQAKTLTVAVTHFTDWSFLSRIRIYPETATLRVGESLRLRLTPCYYHDSLFKRITKSLGQEACEVTDKKNTWHIVPNWVADVGTINPGDAISKLSVIYTAPSKKPTPNVATVGLPFALEGYGDGEFVGIPHRGMFTARITIVDRGYQVSGGAGDTSFSGVICDLGKNFTIKPANPFLQPFEFSPSSANGGSWKMSTTNGVSGGGVGEYKVEGLDTEKPSIVLIGGSTGGSHGISRSGGGDFRLMLTPLTAADGGCSE